MHSNAFVFKSQVICELLLIVRKKRRRGFFFFVFLHHLLRDAVNESTVDCLACCAFHAHGYIKSLVCEAAKAASRRARVGVDHAGYHPTGVGGK